jgi:hypothetical protein
VLHRYADYQAMRNASVVVLQRIMRGDLIVDGLMAESAIA